VQQYNIAPYWSEHYQVMTQERISWTAIGRELRREPVNCYNTWKATESCLTEDQKYLVSAQYDSSTENDPASIRDLSEEEQSSEDPSRNESNESGESDRSNESETPRTAVAESTPKAPHSATKFLKWTKEEVRVLYFPSACILSLKFSFFSSYKDKRLREGVRLYKENGGWRRVAEFVGGNRTLVQCENRYSNTLMHVDGGLPVVVDWSNAEVSHLMY